MATIVIAATSFSTLGGMGIYIHNIIKSFSKRSWSVHCIATNERGNAFNQLDNISYHDFSQVPLSFRKVTVAAELVNRINPNILLLNHCALIHYTLPLLKCTIKPFAVLHSDDSRFYEVAAFFSKRISGWVAPAPGVAEEFHNYLPPARWHNIRLVPHGVNEECFRPLETLSVHGPLITFVGYVAENKGADLLPDIIRRVIDNHPSARLVVVGYGPLKERIEKEFLTLGIADYCNCTGPLSQNEVADLLGASDIFLLPTRIEGFGLAIAEAMLCGAVPVVTHLPGVTDQLVDDGMSGFLVERDDVAMFAGTINALLADEALLRKISAAAIFKGKQRFSLGRMIDDYECIFNEKDDRPMRTQRNRVGWLAELVLEVAKNGSHRDLMRKGRYLFR